MRIDTMRGVDRTERVAVTRVDATTHAENDDVVVVEEPLEIRIGNAPIAITMRTPGDDFDLVTGFLLTEGIAKPPEIVNLRHWGSANVVRVEVRDDLRIDLQKLQRHYYATSSCGVCGKASIDALRVHAERNENMTRVSANTICALPDALRREQKTFESTGAIHAAAAFDGGGSLLAVREDIGRHNAVDKVIGALAKEERSATLLLISGRAGFEVVQKAVVAKIPIIAAVGAPSSLAIELAREFNATLLGFLRDGRFNIYAGDERITRD